LLAAAERESFRRLLNRFVNALAAGVQAFHQTSDVIRLADSRTETAHVPSWTEVQREAWASSKVGRGE
jgi:hypothetical protein